MLCLEDRSLMIMALEEARRAARAGEVPVGAVIAAGDLVVRGHNRTIMDADPTAHAEIVVIREAAQALGNHRILGATLCVTIEPCIMCVGAIVQARIARVVYGAADGRYGAVASMVRGFELDVNHRPVVIAGVMEEEAASLMRAFFQERRRGEVPKWS
ncbi:MAG TPA: nucleoside deaminase [Deltaproteobacteria bacterium]|nr:nucleoside deaminase [Deltaproteobacteria bacterium]HNS90694.1 nucleoside deaminase [Deltaproteobacteria bacterium]HOG84088.1 nucleoside deaminase [Deltaproteobacteria bacterium]HOY76012.1 nucleoside deaminase [Deltaproteobacteria bacterium]HQO61882.1 nucleoside deaminase [Deltaproteobacteria bacterium]